MSDTLQIIKRILNDEPFRIVDNIGFDSEIKSLAGWDSLQYLTFLLEIEKVFNIEITPEEIRKMITINDLINTIKSKK